MIKITSNAKRPRPSIAALRQQITELEKERGRLIEALAASEREVQSEKRMREKYFQDMELLKERLNKSALFAGPGKLLDSTPFAIGSELLTLVRAASALGHICVMRVVENQDDRSPSPVRLELVAHETHLNPVIGFR